MQVETAVASGRDVVVCDGYVLSQVDQASGEWGGVTLWVGEQAPTHHYTLTISESELAQWYFSWASPPRVVWCEPRLGTVALPARVQKVLLTQQSWPAVAGWAQAAGFRDPLILSSKLPQSKGVDVVAMAKLLEELRAFRAEQAEVEGVRRFRVFSDKVLMSLASAFPSDELGFLAVPGCGPQKWQKYGRQITEICTRARAKL